MDNSLYNYLRNVVSLEKSLYTQNQTIAQMNSEINALGIPNSFSKPKIPSTVSPDGGATFGLMWLGTGFGFFIGLFDGAFFASILVGFCIGAVLGMIIDVSAASSSTKRLERQYDYELALYNSAVNTDNDRVIQETIEKDRLREILAMMEERRDGTTQLLKQYYESDIIFPKYRNLIAMCSIFEYFMAGSCDTMKEAYNKYDNEVLMKQILTKLDEVVLKLDSIKQNQYMLYDVIQEGNYISHTLVEASVHQSKLLNYALDNQVLQANYSAQIANEVRFQNQLLVFDSLNNNRR